MIIGSIVDSTEQSTSWNNANGASSVVFYTEQDAITWCRLQSQQMSIPGLANVRCVTCMINTDTEVRRWWWGGTEYTG